MGLKDIKVVTIIVDGKEESAKECRACNEIKPLFDYYNQKRGLGGKQARCKECEHKRKGYTHRRKPRGCRKALTKKIILQSILVNGEELQAKECTSCGLVKVLDNYYKNKCGTGGVNSRCKDCERIIKGSKKKTKKWDNERFDSVLPDGWRRLEEVINGQNSILVECNNGHRSRRRPGDIESKKQGCLNCIEEGFVDRKKKWTNKYIDKELREKKTWLEKSK